MYPKFDCKVITDEANYYFDIFEEENNTADHTTFNKLKLRILKHCLFLLC